MGLVPGPVRSSAGFSGLCCSCMCYPTDSSLFANEVLRGTEVPQPPLLLPVRLVARCISRALSLSLHLGRDARAAVPNEEEALTMRILQKL